MNTFITNMNFCWSRIISATFIHSIIKLEMRSCYSIVRNKRTCEAENSKRSVKRQINEQNWTKLQINWCSQESYLGTVLLPVMT